jgi:hypothetical protein
MFRANFCPSSGAQDLDFFLQHMVQYPVMWYAGVSERSIFTLPTLMMHGEAQIKIMY